MNVRRLVSFVLALALLTACRSEHGTADSARARVPDAALRHDDFGVPIVVDAPPTRIVSLNPTTTELLFALGAGSRLTGRTHWDVYPDSARFVPDLGDGLRPNVEGVLATRPQLVLLYASADNRAAADAFRAAGVRVVSLRIDSIAQFFRAAAILGDLIGAPARARNVTDSVSATLARVRSATASAVKPRVLWPLIDEPLYVIGAGSFLGEIIDIAGGRNVFGDLAAPSPQVAREEVMRRDADVVLTGPESATKIRADPAWRRLTAVRTGRVLAVDPGLAERPSVRLGEAAMAVALLLHPELRSTLVSAAH